MANYATLKSAIQQVVKTNGNNEITGALLQQSLLAMIDSLGAGYQYVGVATPAMNPGTPDHNVFYIAGQSGQYSNFGGFNLLAGDLAVMKYNGSWVYDILHFGSNLGNWFTLDGRVVASNGVIDPAQTTIPRKHTDYIPVIPNETFVISGYATSTVALCAFYDENKTFISSIYVTDTPLSGIPQTVTVPANAAFMRCTGQNDGTDYIDGIIVPIINIILSKLDNIGIEIDSMQVDSQILTEQVNNVAPQDKDLLLNPEYVDGKYISTSGAEISNAACSYCHLQISGKYGYIMGENSGWLPVNSAIIFTNGTTVLGYTSNTNNGVQQSVVGIFQGFNIPDGTTDIYINISTGQKGKVHLLVDSGAVSYPGISLRDYLGDNFISSKECKHYFSTNGFAYNANIRSSLPIKVLPGEQYVYSNWSTQTLGPTSINRVIYFFDANFTILSYTGASTDPYTITVPDNAAWMVVNKIITTTPTLIKTKIGTSVAKLVSNAVVPADSAWNGQIWCGFGASMFQQSPSHVGLSWSPYVEEALGLIYANCGIGGTPIAGYDNPNAYWRDHRIQAVKDTNAALITMGAGWNDLVYDNPIGDDSEFDLPLAEKNKATFKGAYSYVIETLLAWKPSVRLVLCTNSYAHNNGASIEHSSGLTYADYAKATREVAEYYCLPVIDWYAEMGINKLTQSTYTSDNIHWNALGSILAASLVIGKLKELKSV